MNNGEFTQTFEFEDEFGLELQMQCVVEWELEYHTRAERSSWYCEGNDEEWEFSYKVYEVGNEDEEIDKELFDQIKECLYDYSLMQFMKQREY